jgi:hypothetical protein
MDTNLGDNVLRSCDPEASTTRFWFKPLRAQCESLESRIAVCNCHLSDSHTNTY